MNPYIKKCLKIIKQKKKFLQKEYENYDVDLLYLNDILLKVIVNETKHNTNNKINDFDVCNYSKPKRDEITDFFTLNQYLNYLARELLFNKYRFKNHNTALDWRMGLSSYKPKKIANCKLCLDYENWMYHSCLGLFKSYLNCFDCNNIRILTQEKNIKCQSCYQKYNKYMSSKKYIPVAQKKKQRSEEMHK